MLLHLKLLLPLHDVRKWSIWIYKRRITIQISQKTEVYPFSERKFSMPINKQRDVRRVVLSYMSSFITLWMMMIPCWLKYMQQNLYQRTSYWLDLLSVILYFIFLLWYYLVVLQCCQSALIVWDLGWVVLLFISWWFELVSSVLVVMLISCAFRSLFINIFHISSPLLIVIVSLDSDSDIESSESEWEWVVYLIVCIILLILCDYCFFYSSYFKRKTTISDSPAVYYY